ncbi:uncharacterized protein LOC123193246 isoform X2 [Mangifera indica]|uniref:uncharacterized protein LOC123193246 isoform X2 n=1 Tax=Mangifera indica TaxID=29780 RepID=UPI001CFB5783|nr:uncharacterized protein LOC123193246 isoform X2 [Mangifera indica]
MQNSVLEKQDQRTNSNMEDSTAMTIEFLRARLLSERSVSKSARQRADELARRVAELEEQLRFVSHQRKMAEKASADVLAILENNGISDFSESFDSSFDQEAACESKVSNNCNKEEENSVSPKLRRNEWEEHSGLDIDFSPVLCRGLSWEGCQNTSHSSEKYKDSFMRRHRSFGPVGSSPKHHTGKSCRQIRNQESKSVDEESKTKPIKVDSQENEVATSLEEASLNHSNGRPEILSGSSEASEEKSLLEDSKGSLGNGQNLASGNVDFNEHGGEITMEKALEHQAQLIGKYEEMEKAQREWEEWFRENNNSTPDACDPGNQSGVTEEREEIKVQIESPATTINTIQEAKSKDVCFSDRFSNIRTNGFLSPPSQGDVQSLGDQKHGSIHASESLAQDFSFPTANGKQNQESLKTNLCPPSQSSHIHSHDSPGNRSALVFSSNSGGMFSRGELSGSQNELYALVPHKKPTGFNEVLEALRQAKLSLQREVSRVPVTERKSLDKAFKPSIPVPVRESKSLEKAITPSIPATEVWGKGEIPVGLAGLFRLPTDYAVEESRADLLFSCSQPGLVNHDPSTSLGVTVGDQILTNLYKDSRSTSSASNFLEAGDQFVTRACMDRRSIYSSDSQLFTREYSDISSGISIRKTAFDGNLDAVQPSSRRFTYSTISSSPDLMPQTPADERFSTYPLNRPVGMPPSNLDAGLSSSNRFIHPMSPSYPDQMPRILTNEGCPTFLTGRSVGMSPADHLFYCDHTRPNTYR